MLTLPERWSPDCAREPRIPFLDLPGHSLDFRDPVTVAEQLGTLLPVRSCDPVRAATPSEPFRWHMGGLQLGVLGIVALWGTGLQGELEGTELASLVIPYRGHGHFRIGRRSLQNLTGQTLLLIPPGPWRTHNDYLGGVTIQVNPAWIQAVGRTMAGPRGKPERWLGVARAPRVLAGGERKRGVLFERLYRVLVFLDGVVRRHGFVPEPLRLDDVLLRQIVDLLAAGLLAESADPDPPEADGGLDVLIDWMHTHCHEPISLTELEQRSHYSRRQLQYAFKARFGCGPMQYLRRQRLWLARRQLEQGDPGRTVSGVALASGYLSLESFRRDFQSRFGMAPSALLARGRGVGPKSAPSGLRR
jgi:AraC-like DNA-binding protein